MLPGSYARILVPLDGSAESEQILACVETLAGNLGATLLLLRVTTPLDVVLTAMVGTPGVMGGYNPAVNPSSLMEAERQDTILYLDDVGSRLRRKGFAVECVQEEGRPAEVIGKVARQLQVDLIAMASHGRRGIRRLIFGSVADEVESTAPCPVLRVRPGEGCSDQTEMGAQTYRLHRSRRWVPQETIAS
jgi:nucleotide-binding universal stress UspA family protein